MKGDHYDYMIVGGGLAGMTLAVHLHNMNKKLIIFDNSNFNTSSRVAAGLYNPITGRKMVKTWLADQLFPYLIPYYREVELLVDAKFLFQLPIYRPFVSLEEQNEWMGKSADPHFKPYIKTVHTHEVYASCKNQYGGISLEQSGYLDTNAYLNQVNKFFSSHHLMVNNTFELDRLIVKSNKVIYKNLTANKLIFCEGVNLARNPFFNWLPLRPVKGEILEIEMETVTDCILNRGVFVLPITGNLYRVGSSYDHNDLSLAPTEKARFEILDKVNELIEVPYTVVGQMAGIRPATKDRRPFLGLHPRYETIGVFNGLGTKGVSLAPYWAREFCEFLEGGKKLMDEVNISRYFSLYSE